MDALKKKSNNWHIFFVYLVGLPLDPGPWKVPGTIHRPVKCEMEIVER